jgi:hypothetical protein
MTMATIICHSGDDPNSTAAKLLIMAGQLVAEAASDANAESKESARAFVEGVLTAAATGGYAKCALMRTALGSPQRSNRLATMAREACKAAGPKTLRDLIAGCPS